MGWRTDTGPPFGPLSLSYDHGSRRSDGIGTLFLHQRTSFVVCKRCPGSWTGVGGRTFCGRREVESVVDRAHSVG